MSASTHDKYTRWSLSIHKTPIWHNNSTIPAKRAMAQVSSGLSGAACYIDDILILGHTREKHFTNLHTALKGIKKYDCCLKKSKHQFFTKRARVLGHTVYSILPEKVKPTKSRITNNLEVPTPTDKLKLQSFLGMLTYNAKFLPNMSHTLHPLINC